jgi:hypothetical protein
MSESDYEEQLARILRGEQELYEGKDYVRHPRRLGSIKGAWRAPMLPGVAGYSADSKFGRAKETEENTLTWGATQQIIVTAGEANQSTTQLVHVHRKRPTTYTIAVQLTLGANWSGQPAGDLILTIANIIGVGQAKCNLLRTFTVLAANVASFLSAVNEVYTVPGTALQCTAMLSPVNALTSPADAALTILAAPVFE